MEEITTEKILGTMKEWVASKTPIPPDLWTDAAAKLNVLAGDDEAKLADMELELAQKRHNLASNALQRSVASVNVEIQSLPLHRDIQVLKAKIKRIDEFIRIAKLQARLTSEAINRQ